MTKKDFVIAWLLASRSAGDTANALEWYVDKAEQVWEYLEQRYEGETE